MYEGNKNVTSDREKNAERLANRDERKRGWECELTLWSTGGPLFLGYRLHLFGDPLTFLCLADDFKNSIAILYCT